MKYIAMKQQIIKYDHDTCTDKCKATYNEDAVQIYVELQGCLAGKIVVTTTIPTTTAASTTTVIYYSTTTDSYDEH